MNMTDELETTEDTNRAEERIKELSGKVKLTSKERDEKSALLTQRDQELANQVKETEFYKGFSNTASKYPQAQGLQDKIKELVVKGYDIEDATVAVLNREGKLIPPKPEKETVAGGSATTNAQPAKSPADIIKSGTQAERRAILSENLVNG